MILGLQTASPDTECQTGRFGEERACYDGNDSGGKRWNLPTFPQRKWYYDILLGTQMEQYYDNLVLLLYSFIRIAHI